MKIPNKYKKTVLSIEAWYAGYKAGEQWAIKTFREVTRPQRKKNER